MDDMLAKIQKATKELVPLHFKQNKLLFSNKLDALELLLKKTDTLSDLIITKDNPKALVVVSEAVGLYLMKSNITSSQLRNIFGYTKKIDSKVRNTTVPLSKETIHELMLLSPKLAYVAGREMKKNGIDTNRSKALKLLRAFFNDCIERIGNDSKKFKRFIDLFESILSYHKFYGAK